MNNNCLRRYELKARILQSESVQLDRLQVKALNELRTLRHENKRIEQSWNLVIKNIIKYSKHETVKQSQFAFNQNLFKLNNISTLLKANKIASQTNKNQIDHLKSKQQQVSIQLENCQSKSAEINTLIKNINEQQTADTLAIEKACINQNDRNYPYENCSVSISEFKAEIAPQEAQTAPFNMDSLANMIDSYIPNLNIQSQNNNHINFNCCNAENRSSQNIDWETAQQNSDLMQQANSKTKLNYFESPEGENVIVDYTLEPGRLISIEAKRLRTGNTTKIEIQTGNDADRINLSRHKQEMEIITKTDIRIG